MIQHTVYEHRFLFALLRKNKVEIYVQNKHVIIRQKKNKDFGFKFLDKKILKASYKIISNKKIDNYWKKFLIGESKYLEARIAGSIKTKKKIDRIHPVNVVMLHVFRDSPFTTIDRTRIFSDYYNWVFETLRIISKSKEYWIIRKHPSADRWGENQKKIIDQIFYKVLKKDVPKNIIFEDNERSNISQFKSAKRVVTFCGNSHLEAGCFGIKPIIIAETTQCNFDSNLFFKPKTIKQYKMYLLNKNLNFKINKDKIKINKRILFCIHNVINFSNDINSYHLFRNDKKTEFKILHNKILDNIKNKYLNFHTMGYYFGNKTSQSINSKYLKKFFDYEID